MMKEQPFPVTEENFAQCWEYVDRKRRKARVKAAIAQHGGFWTNQAFLLTLLYLANGLIYTYKRGSYGQFLKALPGFLGLWEKIAGKLLQPGASLTENAIKLTLLTYLASIALFGLICALITLVYHPRKQAVPTASYAENTARLVWQAQEARDYSYKTRITTSQVAMVFTIFCGFALFFAYALHIRNPGKVLAMLSTFPTNESGTNALLYVLAAYFVIDWLTAPLLLITRVFYRFDFPYELVVQAETGDLLAQEEFSNLSPEALAQMACTIREEAITLEKEAGYFPAKIRFHQAALLGDVSAMEHFARHCLLLHRKDSARYWLDKCVSTGNASKNAQHMRRRMILRMRHNVEYLHKDGNLTQKQKWLKALGSFAVKLLSLVLVLVLTVVVALGAAKYFAPEGNEIPLSEFLQELTSQWGTGKP